MDDDTSAGAVVFPAWRVMPAWAGRGMVALVALLGVHEGRFAWGLLGLAILALVLVVVALVVGTRALRRSRRALEQLSALVAGGFQAAPVPEQPEPEAPPEEPEPEAPPYEPAPDEPGHRVEAEPELRPIPGDAGLSQEARALEVAPAIPEAAGEPQGLEAEVAVGADGGAAAALLSDIAAPEPSALRDPMCTCGHADSVHLPRAGTEWRMCLGDALHSCSCRRFTPQDDEVAFLRTALENPDPFVRVGVVTRLTGVPEAEDVLVLALGDAHKLVRVAAARALKEARGPAARHTLMKAIVEDLDPDVRSAAIDSLAAWILRSGGRTDSGAA